MKLRLILPLLVIFWAAIASAAPSPSPRPLTAVPLGDSWFLISMDGENKGFARQSIAETPEGYEITSEGSVKLTVMGFSREVSSRESYRVKRDLSLRSFSVDMIIDRSTMRVSGEAVPKGIKLVVETAGNRREKFLKAKGAVFPVAAVNLYPLLRGTAPGGVSRFPVLDVEDAKIKEVKVTALERTALPGGGETIHLRNDLYPMVDNDVWVDATGRTLRESVRDGLVETRNEGAETVRRFMLEAAVAKKDLIFDFSLVKIDPPLARPREIKRLQLELSGVPRETTIPGGVGQLVARGEGDRVVVTTEPAAAAGTAAGPLTPEAESLYLASSDRIQADHPDIARARDTILGGEKDPMKRVQLLNRWVAETIADDMTDSHSAVEVLTARSGNCQSHARLYVALARAAGIPTRFVSGLVYLEGKGFLYHSWAESFVGYWQPLDPTFNQLPVDSTHIRLVEGDSPGEMAPIASLVGRVRARVVDTVY
jgi:hypothetical protein